MAKNLAEPKENMGVNAEWHRSGAMLNCARESDSLRGESRAIAAATAGERIFFAGRYFIGQSLAYESP
jgi:hypothetical protein